VIFKEVREGRPYPDHGFSARDWARIPPHQVRLDTLVTTKRQLGLDTLLADDSTFYGDLFPHAVLWKGELYLEDGLHRCLRAALQQRTAVHVRVLNLDEIGGFGSETNDTPHGAGAAAATAPTAAGPAVAAGPTQAGPAPTGPAPAGPAPASTPSAGSAAPAGGNAGADRDSRDETQAGTPDPAQ
jgi:Arc/MetJ family transcription regulator